MYKISGALQGTADLLLNRMTDDTVVIIDSGTSGGRPTQEARKSEAYQKYLKDDTGAYIDSWMFKQVMAAGARVGNLKQGPRNIAGYLLATVFTDGRIYMTPKDIDYVHVVTGKVPPGPRGKAVIIRRPAFKTGWIARFTLNVLDDRRNADQIRRALEEAGLLVGMGSWRPEYGRFVVSEWEVLNGKG